MLRKLVLAVSLAAIGTLAQAVPVTIIQTFSNVTWDDYGVSDGLGYGQAVTGDWIFKGTVDSDAPNLHPNPQFGGAYAVSVTLTQASLGLFDARITNLQYASFSNDLFSFDTSPTFGDAWSALSYPGQFSDFSAIPLDVLKASSGTHVLGGFAPQWTGFLFEDGARLYGYGETGESTVSVEQAAQVPEPASLALLLAGLAGTGIAARRRRKIH